MKKLYTMGDLAEKTGFPRSTIHYYLRHGLLSPSLKTGETKAYYTDVHLRELSEVRKYKAKGWPLSLIAQELEKQRPSPRNPGEMSSGGSMSTRARSSTPKAEGTRERLIKEASRIFARKGFYRTKVIEITEASGVSRATFYAYFKDKRSFFFECMDSVFQAIVDMLADELAGVDDPLERMMRRAHATIGFYEPYSEIIALIRNALISEDPALAARGTKMYGILVSPLTHDLKTAIRQGLVKKIEPELASFIIVGAVEALIYRLRLNQHFTPEQAVSTVIEVISRGLLRPDEGESKV